MTKNSAPILILGLLTFVAAAVIIAHMVNIPSQSSAAQIIQNGLHAPGFGVVALASYLLLRLSHRAEAAMAATIVFTLGLAFSSEFVQYFGNRDASLGDIFSDVVGITGFLTPALLLDRQIRSYTGIVGTAILSVVGTFAFIASVAPIAYGATTLYLRASQFPSIASFDDDWERGVFRPLNDTPFNIVDARKVKWPSNYNNVAVLDLAGIEYAGLVIDSYPNWQGFGNLSFVAASGGPKNILVTLRVHDQRHNNQWNDRFNATLTVTPELHQFEIPIQDILAGAVRKLDVNNVTKIVVYAHDAPAGSVLILDDFRLTGSILTSTQQVSIK